MLTVKLPNDNLPERKYALYVLLDLHLGLPYRIELHEVPNTIIQLENGRQLIFEDNFFSQFKKDYEYLLANNIPNILPVIKKGENPFIPENDLPIIYGQKTISISEERINCGIDIPASIFFMLTRWEENVLPDRDEHGRFPAYASLSFKSGFLQRPIVEEMSTMTWNMLLHLGYKGKGKQHTYQAIVSHDVDIPKLWRNFPKYIKKLGGDLLVRKNLKHFFFTLKSYPLTALHLQPDPYDTFNYLMYVSERHGMQSHFFFLNGGETKYDGNFNLESSFGKKLFNEIHERGHIIGFHPSYNTCTNEDLFGKELSSLQAISPQPIKCGRQHFLRFEVPGTWELWEKNGMEWESTLGYPEQAGFRCGTCRPFPVFNILTRQQMKLMEVPLIAMEVTFVKYKKNEPGEMLAEIESLINKVKKYGGKFVLLWHNSSFNDPDYLEYKIIYPLLLSEMTAA